MQEQFIFKHTKTVLSAMFSYNNKKIHPSCTQLQAMCAFSASFQMFGVGSWALMSQLSWSHPEHQLEEKQILMSGFRHMICSMSCAHPSMSQYNAEAQVNHWCVATEHNQQNKPSQDCRASFRAQTNGY